MPNLFPTDWRNYLALLPILFRLTGIFIFLPGFSHSVIPATLKIFLSFSLALALYPILSASTSVPNSLGEVVVLVIKELFVGGMIGFSCSLTFEAVSLAAHFMGLQIGLGTVNLVDPQNQNQISLMSSFFSVITITLFFVTNAHHIAILGFIESFAVTDKLVLSSSFSAATLNSFLSIIGQLFWLAIQMALPITFITLATQVVIGVLGRMVPQINLMLVSFSITLAIGLIGVFLIAPEAIEWIESRFGEMGETMLTFVRSV